MRLGKVVYKIEYVVDLDNEDMINEAVEAIFNDLEYAEKNNIDVINAPEAKEEDIPEFLIELCTKSIDD